MADILELGALLPDDYQAPNLDTGDEEPQCLVGRAPTPTRGCYIYGGCVGSGPCVVGGSI